MSTTNKTHSNFKWRRII